jgi:cytochrome c-type biogenesis protein CcmH/NrfG
MTRNNQIRLLLLLVIILVFGRIVTHDFVDWDDGPLIYNNPNISKPTLAGLAHHWNPRSTDNNGMYNPLVYTIWWLIAQGSQLESSDILGATLNPYLFHAASLVVHWLCACVVFDILRQMKFRDWTAAAGALLFALHPLQTESVAWAVGMKDLLSGLFALLTILEFLIAVQLEGNKQRQHYWLMFVFFIAALLSKPSTAVLPFMLVATEWILYRRPWREPAFAWIALMFVLAVPIVVLAAHVQKFPEAKVGAPLWERPGVALDALAFYFAKLVLPVNLSFDYGRTPQALLTDPQLYHAICWTWIFPVLATIIVWRSKQRILWIAGLIFLLGLLPVLGLKPFGYQYYTTVADRYIYLSMLGVAIAAAWFLDRKTASNTFASGRKTAYGVAFVLIALGSLSFAQADRWRDTETLYTSSLSTTKAVHNITLGRYHDDLAAPLAKLTNEAIAAGRQRQAIEYRRQSLAELERAMAYYRKAIELQPTNTNGYDLLAKDQVFIGDIPHAIQTVKEWMAIEPKIDPDIDLAKPQTPGTLEAVLGNLYLRNQQYAEAVSVLKQSIKAKPDPDTQKMLQLAETLLAKSQARPTSAR